MSRSSFSIRTRSNIPAAAAQAAEKAAKAAFSELFGEMQDAIGQKVWSWPRQTVRSNGSIAGSPRTAVDTGLLRASGVALFPTATTCTFVWTATYASFVHDGAWIFPYGDRRRERVYTPGRPWTLAVSGAQKIQGIVPYPFAQRFAELWPAFFKP